MKKLMIAVAVALAGIAVNAASVTWTTSSYAALPAGSCTTGKDLGKGKDVMMFVWEFAAADWNTDYQDGEKLWAAVQGGDLKLSDAKSKQSSSTAAAPKVTGATSWAADDQVYAAILYLHSDEQKFTATDANFYMANYATSKATDAGATVGNLGNKIAGTGAAISWTAAAVPEPTSGLLLLLGMAGLALRRRRA